MSNSLVEGNDLGILTSNPAESGSTIENTVARNNTNDGIQAGLSSTLRNTTAVDNGGVGIRADQDTTVVDSTARDNAVWDFVGEDLPGPGPKHVTVENLDIGASTAPHTTLEYADADVSGISESTLDVWKHNGTWTELGAGPGTDLAANEVQYNVTPFSTFGVFGQNATTTPTPSPTPTPTQTPTPTPGTTATPTSASTFAETPGFGLGIAVVAVVTLALLTRWRRR